MRSTFMKHESMIKTMQRDTTRNNQVLFWVRQERVIRRSLDKQESRKRLGNYFK